VHDVCHSKLHSEQFGKALSSHFSRIAPASDNILNCMTEAYINDGSYLSVYGFLLMFAKSALPNSRAGHLSR